MNYVKRHGCLTAKMAVENFVQIRAQFLFDIQSLVEIEEIPSSLIVNWDQTAIKYVQMSTWTMADKGSKLVEIVGLITRDKLLQYLPYHTIRRFSCTPINISGN